MCLWHQSRVKERAYRHIYLHYLTRPRKDRVRRGGSVTGLLTLVHGLVLRDESVREEGEGTRGIVV